MLFRKKQWSLLICMIGFINLAAQQKAKISIDAAAERAVVSPALHGIFFEEISHAGEGGLYAELIQNRGFEEANIPPGMTRVNDMIIPPKTPGFTLPNNEISDWTMPWKINTEYPAWTYLTTGTAGVQVSRTTINPLNAATPHSLQVNISNADYRNTVNIINKGFWGINIVEKNKYKLNFYLRSSQYKGNITASLQGADGSILASYNFSASGNDDWKKYSTVLTASKSDSKASFVLSFDSGGCVWLDFVSLFPEKTFKGRANGLRPDLAKYIAALHPAFIRWPGGCFVEGINIQSAPNWKETIGPIENRMETYSPWGYYTSNGFGYHEYLQFCEDIGAAALYVFNAGVSCEYRSGTFATDDSLQPYIQNALDAIEYAIGPVNSKWGKVRAANGHTKPFPLKYVEVGNEQSGPRYAERYNLFYSAIKSRYPQIQIIASMGSGRVNDYTTKGMKHIDLADEHAYKSAGWAFRNPQYFDQMPRGQWKIYVGEYATNGGVGAGNMEAALSDAMYMMLMEKNSDLIKMSSYAPLLVNTNDISWPVNLINFDNSKSFARISYYAIKMFNENKPTINTATTISIDRPKTKIPQFSGKIGLATWDTKTAYKNIEVIKDGKLIYKSNFLDSLSSWELLRGNWIEQDSALLENAYGAQTLAMLNSKNLDTYTLKLQAKKVEGYNAFIIPFAIKDSNSFLRIHIGAWLNRIAVFEKVSNGYDVNNISATVQLPDTVQTDKWYDIALEVGTDSVKCFLNNKLLLTYTEPEKLFAISGKDALTGDLIVKVVNAYDSATDLSIELKNAGIVQGKAKLISLSAHSLTDENSFLHPQAFHPQESIIDIKNNSLSLKAPPYSIMVFRIPMLKKKNRNK